jgi:hypothetical protein
VTFEATKHGGKRDRPNREVIYDTFLSEKKNALVLWCFRLANQSLGFMMIQVHPFRFHYSYQGKIMSVKKLSEFTFQQDITPYYRSVVIAKNGDCFASTFQGVGSNPQQIKKWIPGFNDLTF